MAVFSFGVFIGMFGLFFCLFCCIFFACTDNTDEVGSCDHACDHIGCVQTQAEADLLAQQEGRETRYANLGAPFFALR